MSYVYDKVGSDPLSHQTPHFGFIDGDGDFVFDTSILASIKSEDSSKAQPDIDIFIKAPTLAAPDKPKEETVADILKKLIGNPVERIRLNDFIHDLLRKASESLSSENFPVNAHPTDEEFTLRLQMYEDAIQDLITTVILLAHWGGAAEVGLLEKIFARVAEIERANSGLVVWIKLSWYPLLLLMYATGIASLAARRYDKLWVALTAPAYSEQKISNQNTPPVVLPVISNLADIGEDFKRLPGMERKFVPRSEHIFKKLQPALEDQLLIGRSYDTLFDDFEIFLALTFADLHEDVVKSEVWGPLGRFGWKERGRIQENPVYTTFVATAKKRGKDWEPLQFGFFRGSSERFAELANAFGRFLSQIGMW